MEKVGEVHVRKEIVTEERQITVPVTREVLRVERVSVSHEVGDGTKLFEKESYDIPIREEHVTVEKRAVVREELHVGKEIQQAEEVASATVRRERADIETWGPSAARALRAASRHRCSGGQGRGPRAEGRATGDGMHLVLFLIFGVAIGALARLIVPGDEPGGWVPSMLAGVAGAYAGGLGGWAARALPELPEHHRLVSSRSSARSSAPSSITRSSLGARGRTEAKGGVWPRI